MEVVWEAALSAATALGLAGRDCLTSDRAIKAGAAGFCAISALVWSPDAPLELTVLIARRCVGRRLHELLELDDLPAQRHERCASHLEAADVERDSDDRQTQEHALQPQPGDGATRLPRADGRC